MNLRKKILILVILTNTTVNSMISHFSNHSALTATAKSLRNKSLKKRRKRYSLIITMLTKYSGISLKMKNQVNLPPTSYQKRNLKILNTRTTYLKHFFKVQTPNKFIEFSQIESWGDANFSNDVKICIQAANNSFDADKFLKTNPANRKIKKAYKLIQDKRSDIITLREVNYLDFWKEEGALLLTPKELFEYFL